MSSNIPFAYPILDISAGNNSVVYVPAFPGAYIYDVYPANENGSFIPIYTSISDFTVNGFSPLFNNVDNQVIVLPGYSLEMYADANYGGALVYTLDNSGNTDYAFLVAPSINTASSCKLSYTPTSSGIKSLISYQLNPDLVVLSGGAISYATVNNINYAVFTFTATGTMNIRSPVSTVSAEVLVVAGGGSGGTANSLTHCAGGGGAGGVAIGTMTLSRNTTYTCTVGAGALLSATNGANSTITNPSSQSLLVYGGGAGARDTAAGNGGSGGGASKNGTATNYLNKGTVLPTTNNNTIGATVTFYGNAGGISRQASGNAAGGGGGGGAGAVGGDAPANTDQAGAGGNGTTWAFNSTVYGGGGGGGQASNGYAVPPGGTGGGGNGARYSTINATNGTNGRGGGGGGGYGSDFGWGGSGIIIVAIKMSDLN